MEKSYFRRVLLQWYEQHKRDLPWRQTNDPYRVWLSEIILQQTRVNQGLAYYQKFIKHYPTIQHLAKAPQDQVLKDWEGLGYYSRARNLHETAQHLVAKHEGRFPTTYPEILGLKGVGPYTAAAVASFSYDLVTPVIDGNVQRVLSRIFGISLPVNEKAGQKAIRAKAEEFIDPQNPAIYNQAIMELGALQCVPHKPPCGQCPFEESCQALRQNKITEWPVKKKIKYNRERYLHYFYLQKQGKICLEKRGEKGIWKGLYQWPCIETPPSGKNKTATENFAALGFPDFARDATEIISLKPHKLSHQTLHITIYTIKYQKEIHRNLIPSQAIWVNAGDVHKFAFPRPLRKFLDRNPVPLPFDSKID